MDYKALIREVPDFPKPGILFYDITTLVKNAGAFRTVMDELTQRYRDKEISKIVGIVSRGIIVGSPLAYRLGACFVPVKKACKVTADQLDRKSNIEYGA